MFLPRVHAMGYHTSCYTRGVRTSNWYHLVLHDAGQICQLGNLSLNFPQLTVQTTDQRTTVSL
jgi:hypothetical protein